ncbi:MAG TPA: YihY family inner membrane protein [Desulfobacteraceae bacterium]|nr:YihY family inner membrane protein [Desulfobacteraceae bacterium]
MSPCISILRKDVFGSTRGDFVKAQRILLFFKSDVWRIQENELPRIKALLLRLVRIVLLSFRGILEDKCQLRASALTFYSVLSLVPVLAMLFGIAKGFGVEKLLQKQLVQNLEAQQQVITRVINFATTLLENTRGGLMVGAGLLFLFWTTLNVLSNIEDAFNEIWGVKRARTITRKVIDYLALTLIGPFLVVLSATLTMMVTGEIKGLVHRFAILDAVGPAVMLPLKLAPYAVLWILFIFIYSFMPNTKVRTGSAILGGIIAGTLFQIFQWVYISFQIGVARYNAIYGSFAALPLFLIWLNWSWLIVLYGAEVSFAHQNVRAFELEKDWSKVSFYRKKVLAIAIVHHLIGLFAKGGGKSDEMGISRSLGVPLRPVMDILSDLVRAGVVSRVTLEKEKGEYYQPGMDPDTITIKRIMDAMEHSGTEKIPVETSPVIQRIEEALRDIEKSIDSSSANLKLKDI